VFHGCRYAVLAMTGLSFLGLGAQPTPGRTIIAGPTATSLAAWWYTTPLACPCWPWCSLDGCRDWLEAGTRGVSLMAAAKPVASVASEMVCEVLT
jgi:hypothetical protein